MKTKGVSRLSSSSFRQSGSFFFAVPPRIGHPQRELSFPRQNRLRGGRTGNGLPCRNPSTGNTAKHLSRLHGKRLRAKREGEGRATSFRSGYRSSSRTDRPSRSDGDTPVPADDPPTRKTTDEKRNFLFGKFRFSSVRDRLGIRVLRCPDLRGPAVSGNLPGGRRSRTGPYRTFVSTALRIRASAPRIPRK